MSESDVVAELRSFGLSEKRIDGALGMARGLQSGYHYENRRSMLTTTPTTLRAWAAEQASFSTLQ